jgi:hypothetical protein
MTDASGTVIRYAAGGAAGRRRFDDQEAAGDGAFGARMAAYLGGEAGEAGSAQTLLSSKLVVTQLRCDRGLTEVSAPISAEKAFIVSVHLTDISFHELRLRGAVVHTGRHPKGALASLILKTVPAPSLPPHFLASIFYVRRATLDVLVAEQECQQARQPAFSAQMAA